ncbi:MAG: TauD/TfdA dioxygenase family protein [Acidimicrobiia bacterium]
MAELTIERLTESVGAEILGVDHERLLNDEELPKQVLDALEEHGVLVFREINLDDATQVAFSRRLGKLEVLGGGEFPEIFLVTIDPARNPYADYLRGTFDWHIDGCTDDVPIMATMLSAHGVAESGGETEFSSTYAAYDRLSDEDKERLASVRVVHSVEATQRPLFPNPTPEQVALWRSRPGKEQPMVWNHRSGRRSLVCGATADYVVGLDFDAGRALLEEVLEHCIEPDQVYRHVWKVGDVVIWDNRGVLHRALHYEATSSRDMHRTTFTGDEPIA